MFHRRRAPSCPRRPTRFAAGFLLVALLLGGPGRVFADDGTPTVTPTGTSVITLEPTARPTARPTDRPTARPTAEPTWTAVSVASPVSRATPKPDTGVRRHHHRHPAPTATATKTRKRKRKHAHAKPTPTRTPKPTATPALSLNAEDSITPVTCNGPKKPNAAHPFLYAPYHGWTSIVSYVDHDMPNFSVDGIVETATGASATADQTHQGSGFPAYWSSSLRQYLYYDGHNGYDFNLWYQPVYAAAAGKVIFAAFEYPDLPDHGYGKMVMIDHGHGYVTLYGHFSRILVHQGQKVKRGQRIGISGNTGHSTGPHLHFTVFHNCTPTDPYGWTGAGDDPLQQYQGETSEFLWLRAPLVSNPLPHWPGIGAIPVGSVTRIGLLRLPSTRRGTGAFTRDLQQEAARTARALRSRGLSVTVDLLRAVVVVSGMGTANELYAIPDIVSITTPDIEEGDREDVLHTLALAALSTPHSRLRVARSSTWKGYLLRWQNRTFLVGTGAKGHAVDLQLDDGGKKVAVHRLHADPRTGAFAADLGRLSLGQTAKLTRELEGRGTGGSSVSLHSAPRPAPRHPVARSVTRTAGPPIEVFFLILAALAGLGMTWYRRSSLWPGRRNAG